MSRAGINGDWRKQQETKQDDDKVSTVEKDVDELKTEVQQLKARVTELEKQMAFINDCNLLVPFVAAFYTEVYKAVRCEFFEHSGRSAFVYRNWVEMLQCASYEAQEFERHQRQDEPLNTMIQTCMRKIANISLEDWAQLQSIRRERNSHSHPPMDEQQAFAALQERWASHPAGPALAKVVSWMAKMKSRYRRT